MPANEAYDVVHELTRKADHRESCHSSLRGRGEKKRGLWVQDGWIDHRPLTEGAQQPLRTPHWVWVESSETVGKCMANVGVQQIKTCEGCDERG